jgi:hypothetical protein
MPESSSLTFIVTDESPRVKSQAVRWKAAPSVATYLISDQVGKAVSSPVMA